MATSTWTLREIARESGRPLGHVTAMARAGLVPGYRPAARQAAKIPDVIARDVIVVLRHSVLAPRFTGLMKSDPATAGEGVAALARLVQASAAVGEEAPAA